MDELIERMKKLKEKGYINIDDKKAIVRGSFIPQKSHFKIKEAYSKKKEADAIFYNNRKIGFKLYFESIFLYIEAFLEQDEDEIIHNIEINISDYVSKWKGIYQFIKGIIKRCSQDENEIIKTLDFIAFNVVFHYLPNQAKFYLSTNQVKDIDKINTMGIEIINEVINLKNIFLRTNFDKFIIIKLETLEEYVRKMLL